MKPTTATCSLAVILSGLAIAASAAETTLIYKTIDADGTTVFTDQPIPEAQIVTPPPLNVADPVPATTTNRHQSSTAPTADNTTQVDSVTIISPVAEQTFIDPQSPLWVEYELSPVATLPVGLSARVIVDDRILSTGNGNRLPIDIPERGAHTIQIQILDSDGAVQSESDLIDIHVRHHVAGSTN